MPLELQHLSDISQHPIPAGQNLALALEHSQMHRSKMNPVGFISWQQAWHQLFLHLAHKPAQEIGVKVERLKCCNVPPSILSVTPVHAECWDEELMVFMGTPGL